MFNPSGAHILNNFAENVANDIIATDIRRNENTQKTIKTCSQEVTRISSIFSPITKAYIIKIVLTVQDPMFKNTSPASGLQFDYLNPIIILIPKIPIKI